MKRNFKLALLILLALALLSGCKGSSKNESETDISSHATDKVKTIRVGATPSPHAEILNVAKTVLQESGYELEIVEFTDYVQPNLALANGELDANFFQHQPYLENFNSNNGTDLVSVLPVHFEPLGIYPGRTKTLENLKDSAVIAVPNDTTNEARALQLLAFTGLIKLKEGVGLEATVSDIIENPKKLVIKEIEAAQIPRSLQDVDLAVINGNYAIEAGLEVEKDALVKEDPASDAANTFANIIVVRRGYENNEGIYELIKAIQSEEVSEFISNRFKGAVVSVF